MSYRVMIAVPKTSSLFLLLTFIINNVIFFIMKTLKTCTQCGNQFVPRLSSRATENPFCSAKCYGEWQKGKSFTEQRKKTKEKRYCSINQCNEIHFGKGYCRKHYREFVLKGKRYPSKTQYKCEQCGRIFRADIRTGRELPRFCSAVCMGLFMRKPFIIKKGYKKLLIPDHPRSDSKGYVFEHIVIMESVLERPIINGEECHHKDRNKLNNSPSNLLVCSNHSEHMKHHERPPCVIE